MLALANYGDHRALSPPLRLLDPIRSGEHQSLQRSTLVARFLLSDLPRPTLLVRLGCSLCPKLDNRGPRGRDEAVEEQFSKQFPRGTRSFRPRRNVLEECS